MLRFEEHLLTLRPYRTVTLKLTGNFLSGVPIKIWLQASKDELTYHHYLHQFMYGEKTTYLFILNAVKVSVRNVGLGQLGSK